MNTIASKRRIGARDRRDDLGAARRNGVQRKAGIARAAAARALFPPATFKAPSPPKACTTAPSANSSKALLGGNGNQETIWQFTGLFTDEYRSSDTFSQRNDADQRVTQTQDAVLSPLYVTLQQTRGFAHNALLALQQFEPTTSEHAPGRDVLRDRVRARSSSAEDFCNGIPLELHGRRHSAVHRSDDRLGRVRRSRRRKPTAASRCATGTDAATAQVKNALSITKGTRAARPGTDRGRRRDGGLGSGEFPVRRELFADHQRQRLVDHDDEQQALLGRRQRRRDGDDHQRAPVRFGARSARSDDAHRQRLRQHDAVLPAGDLESRRPGRHRGRVRRAAHSGGSEAAGQRHRAA